MTYYLKKKKYDSLLREAKKLNYVPYYICSTLSGIYSFNLHKVKPTFTERLMPATTQFKNCEKIYKKVAMLDVQNAKEL